MKTIIIKTLSVVLCMVLFTTGCNSGLTADEDNTTQSTDQVQQEAPADNETLNSTDVKNTDDERPPRPEDESERPPRPEDESENSPKENEDGKATSSNENKGYNIQQAISDNAQLKTIAYNGLAFITGSAGADSFFPPGKVADFSGFQYMRDNDQNGLGHNTTFLTIAATNVLHILDEDQLAKLTELASSQKQLFENFAMGRFTMMVSFRNHMEGNYPENIGLDEESVAEYASSLYEIDATLSYERAQVMGEIIATFTDEQKAYFEKLDFYDSSTWPVIENGEDIIDKQSMTHTEHVAVMTYSSELFSWYLGNIDADAYFCPERHGTYFGGFYMKDYYAMGNPEYFISTTVTGDSGEEFLNILSDEQRAYITDIIPAQSDSLNRIVEIRYAIAQELRKSMTGDEIDKELVFGLVSEYGYLDGEMSYMYADAFAKIKDTLSQDQLDSMYELRNLDIYPDGAFMYSEPIDMPDVDDGELLFK